MKALHHRRAPGGGPGLPHHRRTPPSLPYPRVKGTSTMRRRLAVLLAAALAASTLAMFGSASPASADVCVAGLVQATTVPLLYPLAPSTGGVGGTHVLFPDSYATGAWFISGGLS